MSNSKRTKHDVIETSVTLLIILTLLTVSVGGLVEIVPLFFQHSTTSAVDNNNNPLDVKPYDALRLMGRNIYQREGCYLCHSQMIRPFRAETERYGHYSVAGEFIYDHPFQWGSKRIGPDLARVGGRYSDQWQEMHLRNPRDLVPESPMPAFPWLDRKLDNSDIHTIKAGMRSLRIVGVPYTDEDIDQADSMLEGKTEMEALVAYLQGLGTALSNFK